METLYGRVVVPSTVLSELQSQATPPKVKEWISNRPGWLEVNRTALPADPSLAHLDAGERDAIILAQNLKADLLLMDDLGGRREAVRRNLKITGTSRFSILLLFAGLLKISPPY